MIIPISTSIPLVCHDTSWQSVLLVELMDYTENYKQVISKLYRTGCK